MNFITVSDCLVAVLARYRGDHAMTAYLIADVDVTDPALFKEYARDVPATEAHYGGRYLGRGGPTKVLEGDWQPHRLVIVEFPNMDSLLAWYESPEYAHLKALRQRCAKTRIIALEGVAVVAP